MTTESLTTVLRQLRRDGRIGDARALIAKAVAQTQDPRLAHLAWQHEPFWWEPLRGPRVVLQRRGPADAALVRRLWSDEAFMSRFNRTATALPASDDALRDLLHREHWGLVEETRSLHWTIHAQGEAIGFISVADIAFGHRRAEYLIGVLPGTHPWLAPEASHLMLGFLAERLKLERLTAYFYPENQAAIRVACKLGFQVEGTLRGYLRTPEGGRADLVAAGLLLDDAYFAAKAALRRRLLRTAPPQGEGLAPA